MEKLNQIKCSFPNDNNWSRAISDKKKFDRKLTQGLSNQY